MPNQNWVWGVYIYHKYWDNTRFRQKKLHVYDFQVRLWVAAFLAFLVLKFWKCGKMWPSISKWTYTCQKNLKIQVWKYSAFDLAFLTFVGLFKILLRSLRSKKSGSRYNLHGHYIIKNSYHWKFPILNQCVLVAHCEMVNQFLPVCPQISIECISWSGLELKHANLPLDKKPLICYGTETQLRNDHDHQGMVKIYVQILWLIGDWSV